MSMQMNDRRIRVVELVATLGLATARQIQLVEFEPSSQGKLCKRELTGMVSHSWLDVVPGRKANEPAIYRVSGKASNGLKLLKFRWGEEQTRKRLIRVSSPHHLLSINDVRAMVIRGCRDLGYNLGEWRRSEELENLLTECQLIPDGYFQIQRVVGNEIKTHAFFLEVERAAKSHNILKDKLERYAHLVFDGKYQTIFNHDKLPRVLFAFAHFATCSPTSRIKAGLKLARNLEIPIANFVELDQLRQGQPEDFFTAPIWHSVLKVQPTSLC